MKTQSKKLFQYCLLLLSLLCYYFSFGQNFQLFNSAKTYHYLRSNGIIYTFQAHPDSTRIEEADTILQNKYSTNPRDLIINNASGLFGTVRISPSGISHVGMTSWPWNGKQRFIKTNAGLNESWSVDEGDSARVIAIENRTILGQNELVKVIQYDSLGTIAVIGENLGLIEWAGFTLIGHSDLPDQLSIPKLEDIYDFEIGDEFHYTTNVTSWTFPSFQSNKNEALKIIDKNDLPNDIVYTIRQSGKLHTEEEDAMASEIILTDSYFSDTLYDTIPKNYFLYTTAFITKSPFYPYQPFQATLILDSLQKGFVNSDPYFDDSESNESTVYQFGLGLRNYYYGNSIYNTNRAKSLIFYKKQNGEEWGNPLGNLLPDSISRVNDGTPISLQILNNDFLFLDGSFLDTATIDLNQQMDGVQNIITTAEGNWVADHAGNVSFYPDEGFFGTAKIQYSMRDALGNESDLVDIIVKLNAQPITKDDYAITNQNTTVIIDVIANDHDPDDSLNIQTIDLKPSNIGLQNFEWKKEGTWKTNNNGTVSFFPATGFTGIATTRYKIYDYFNAPSNQSTITVEVKSVLGNDELEWENKLKIFPNPTRDILHIQTEQLQDIQLWSLDGKLVLRSDASEMIDLSHLSNGSYLLELNYQDGTKVHRQVIKE
ncbi:MAG: T9SS type A sorting domain-containing protein [Bacteroidetes bacterium]|nr:MAG: T9SS type A sorting domain-containing protein [Bacteroidota bacterium]